MSERAAVVWTGDPKTSDIARLGLAHNPGHLVRLDGGMEIRWKGETFTAYPGDILIRIGDEFTIQRRPSDAPTPQELPDGER